MFAKPHITLFANRTEFPSKTHMTLRTHTALRPSRHNTASAYATGCPTSQIPHKIVSIKIHNRTVLHKTITRNYQTSLSFKNSFCGILSRGGNNTHAAFATYQTVQNLRHVQSLECSTSPTWPLPPVAAMMRWWVTCSRLLAVACRSLFPTSRFAIVGSMANPGFAIELG